METENEIRTEDLRRMSKEELDSVFSEAQPPSVDEFDGGFDGIVLSGEYAEELPDVLNRVPQPWKGKRVEARPPKGVGRNVYGFGALEVTGYEFEGRVMSSVFDGDDAYVFDYDKPDNPWFIRQVRDEVRRVSRGLYLGRMNVRRGGGYDFVTYFGLRRS